MLIGTRPLAMRDWAPIMAIDTAAPFASQPCTRATAAEMSIWKRGNATPAAGKNGVRILATTWRPSMIRVKMGVVEPATAVRSSPAFAATPERAVLKSPTTFAGRVMCAAARAAVRAPLAKFINACASAASWEGVTAVVEQAARAVMIAPPATAARSASLRDNMIRYPFCVKEVMADFDLEVHPRRPGWGRDVVREVEGRPIGGVVRRGHGGNESVPALGKQGIIIVHRDHGFQIRPREPTGELIGPQAHTVEAFTPFSSLLPIHKNVTNRRHAEDTFPPGFTENRPRGDPEVQA